MGWKEDEEGKPGTAVELELEEVGTNSEQN
jgi:hypothetical protein